MVPRLLAFVTLGAAVVFGVGVGSLAAAGQQTPKAVKGELIVGFAEGVSRDEQNAILKDAGATSKKRFGQIDAVLVKVKDDEQATVTKLLSGEPRVSYVEANNLVSIAVTPDDPSFSQLWGLHNTGQTGGANDKDIDAPEAWNLATGDPSIVVAVSDTGVDFTHPDLVSQRWVNSLDPVGGGDDDGNGLVDDWSGWDFVNNDNDPFDDHRHGTHVSGTIGAAGNNGIGVVGVNWDVKIMALKFLDASGSGSTADAIESTLYAADHGADVSSNSWGGGPYDQALLDAIEYGASKGMLFVAAAGNDSRNNDVTPTYPATYDSDTLLAVAATDHNDGLAFFSSYGATSVDLGAPGVGILSTTPGNTYQSLDGTSMATPHVAGAAALVKDQFPGATPHGIKALLMNSVDPAAALAGKTATGGRLNVANALSCVNEPKVVLTKPADGFVAGIDDVISVRVLGANCATPVGVGNVTVNVNGTPVELSAETPDPGVYTGSYAVGGQGALTVTATVTVGAVSDTQTAEGNAFPNYSCQDVPFSWVDVTAGTQLTGAGGDDTFSTLGIGFPITYFGQTYTTAFVSSNGFLTLGSSSGAAAPLNVAIPTAAAPNGVIAPFWDDLNPGAGGAVYAAVTGSSPNRALHVEWFNVPHFSSSGSGTATFEVRVQENGDVRFQYLDTDFGNASWNFGASATSGVEKPDGVVGRQVSLDQPQLVNSRAVGCTGGPAPPATPPGAPAAPAASAADGVVHLSWQAPAADGGSPVTDYRIHRGTTPGGETFLTSVGVVTAFDDSTVVNGTTYYYRVSAVNAVGEGPLSNEVSATPTGVTPPAEPLPTLDGFNRPDEKPLSDGGRWSNGIEGTGAAGFRVTSNQLACTKSTTCTSWRNDATYGPDVEAWARISTLPGTGNGLRLYVRVQQPGSAAADGYMLRTTQLSGTDQILLDRLDNATIVTRLTIDQELALGDRLLLRAQGSTLEVWRHNGSTWTRLGSVTDSTYAAAGYVGVGLRGTTGRLDDFGGRKLGLDSPGAPAAPAASAADGVVHLSWQAPAADGGSPVTDYRIHRGTTPGGETFLTSVGVVTAFDDSAVVNGTTYYYRVSAVNAVGEGPLSNEVSATPAGVTPPAEPLPTLDGFNRPDESPLSDGGRWSNGIEGTGAAGFRVTSNQLACTKSTTCTSWRNDATYGPDVEAWARISTLPGTGNGLRLYVRVQQPGSAAADGYMLRTTQLSGTDQILLDRLDNATIVTRLTIDQELALGDRLLLRAQGSTLEVWRHNGSTWTRLGSVTDSTYAAAGYVGVGLRGTTGRLDDFGGRKLGLDSPGAPAAPAASAADGVVHLSWQAPAADGGSPVTDYRIHRGTTPGGETFLTSVGVVTAFDDSAVVNGTTYYYRVSAVNAVGEGPLSNEVSATPAGVTPPAEPLPTLDGFNRPDESPLSDGGRWSNGIEGTGAAGFRVTSNQLACTKSTTCTSWRNDATYGPDVEAWARISTLPGTGNGLRLYVRVQQPGSAAADGYMLRTTQLSGTDQILLDRLDNATIVTRLTIDQELALGDRLLLRAQGSTLEVWRHDGSTWTRLGSVTDSTYAAAGYAGVGLRGTTGRLDDFGGRSSNG